MSYPLLDRLARDGKLVHRLDFRPLKATLADLSGNGYDPTVVGGVIGASGGLRFDGSTGYLDLDAHVAAIASLTEGTLVSGVRVQEQPAGAVWSIMAGSDSGDANSDLMISVSGDKFDYLVEEGGGGLISDATTADVDTAQDLFLAVTQDSSGYAGYINGLADAGLAGAVDAFFDNVNDIDAWRIGCRRIGGTNQDFFKGVLFYWLVFNVALTATEISILRGELANP